jgi:hypothetical protein
MRLSEDKIKEAILHADSEIRERATRYFAESYRPDPSIMPIVIKAVETYGRSDASPLIEVSRDLAQTEETLTWVVAELNDQRCEQDEEYAYDLSMILVQADPALLMPRKSSIDEARHFAPDLRDPLEERLQMMSWDAAIGWLELERLCEQGKDKQYISEFDVPRAHRIVEALARHGRACEDKIVSVLSQKIEDYRNHPMGWLEPFAVRLAGMTRLESTVPLIVARLLEDRDDLLNEECTEALGRIGTPSVLEAIAEAFPTARDHFRIYATGILEHIHSDQSVETCLDLLRREKDGEIRMLLAQSLLSLFAFEGIEATRQLLLRRPLDFTTRGLRRELVENATLMGVSFPELEKWRASGQDEQDEYRRTMEIHGGDREGQSPFGPSQAAAPRLTPIRRPEGQPKVGRNDPCPCGSGKKFKTCCMRK